MIIQINHKKNYGPQLEYFGFANPVLSKWGKIK